MGTVSDTLTTALRELGIVDVTDAAPPAELSALALGILNRLLDEWNANRQAVYADVHAAPVALSAGVNPHTIGLSANSPTIAVTGHRPVSVEGVRLTTDDGETYLTPLTKRDAAWWHRRSAPGTASDYPTDFYYEPTWPNGSIYFYPEPSSSTVKAQLWYRTILAQVELSTVLSLPPGYLSAITETVKERLTDLPMFKNLASGDIKEAARQARALAFGNNSPVQPLCTADYGMGADGGRVYDHLTGPYSLMGR